ncbi:pentatricopeptide repeat-containing protein At1g06140, mitochondrial-like [Zingiber officinale]|uniref:pentatricopeptide repeat-containing protein At1g06140, mitochondrial-like n=1 Tax=Zingiber officinale TaxID=94328 RepID=UPI001C4CB71C|nr:pentatricopeptide repeat-containing protein At1g06140, mitochondrial-like [Zingiber officinale]
MKEQANFVANGKAEFHLLNVLPSQEIKPSERKTPTATFVHLFKASSRTVTPLLEAQSRHSVALKASLFYDDGVRLGLLNIYAKCGFFYTACKLFDEMRNRNVLSWTILISSHSRVGKFEDGINVFADMLADGVSPNCVSLSIVLKYCMDFVDLPKGKSIHGRALRNGIKFDVALQNSILDLYAKYGTLACTKNVFRLMREKDVILLNIMIGTYLRDGAVETAMSYSCLHPIKMIRVGTQSLIDKWSMVVV